MFECTKCSYQSRQYSRLISHYRFAHSFDRNFFILCSVDGCQKSYSLVDSLVRHIKRKHTAFYDTHLSRWKQDFRDPQILQSLTEQNDNISDETENLETAVNENFEIVHFNADNEEYAVDHVKKLAVFLMTLRERFSVTFSALTFLLGEISCMIGHHQAYLSKSVYSFLRENNINDQQLMSDLEHLMRQRSEIESACDVLNSEYKLHMYMRKNFKFVPSEEFILGTDDTGNQESYQYISIIKTIQGLLQYDDVFSYVLNDHQSEGDILGDICDGELYQTHPLFSTDKTALQILLYYDDFTVTNPLGTKTKKFKLGAFYMMLGNLPPKHRSQLHTIQLVALCHAEHLKKYGFHTILRPLIFDLKILESEGCIIEKNDGPHHLFGSVLITIADNLGSHGIGGFMESFNCLRNCRFCFCTRIQMNNNLECDNFPRRTVEMYNQQVAYVKADNSLSTVYGIKDSCCLNELENFHAVNCLPSDIAHDLFEGILCDVMKLIISHCVVSKYFTLCHLNKRIKEYKYADTDKVNKPNTVMTTLSKFNVKQTASQMWCFVRLLPLFIGDKVPFDDSKWQMYLCMRDVLLYVCAPLLEKGHISVMKDVIEDFQEAFKSSFPEENVKPKRHFLLHYPMETLLYGPLIHIQTLRFEGKHNYFKEIVHRSKNKKNICKTLANRHQYSQCLYHTSTNFLKSDELDSSGGSMIPLSLLRHDIKDLLSTVVTEEEVFKCNSVEFRGVKYSTNNCLPIELEADLYQFGKIEFCFVIKGVPYLLLKKLVTKDFDRHFYGYAVIESDEFKLCNVLHLKEAHSLALYPHPTRCCKLVVMKYKVLF